MNIKKVIKNDNGTFLVDCEFTQEEFDSIIEIGLNVLLASGAVPFQAVEGEEDTFEVIPPSKLQ